MFDLRGIGSWRRLQSRTGSPQPLALSGPSGVIVQTGVRDPEAVNLAAVCSRCAYGRRRLTLASSAENTMKIRHQMVEFCGGRFNDGRQNLLAGRPFKHGAFVTNACMASYIGECAIGG